MILTCPGFECFLKIHKKKQILDNFILKTSLTTPNLLKCLTILKITYVHNIKEISLQSPK